MADTALRDLERALAAGDEHARRALVTAYLREGRAQQALGLLEGGPPELRPLEQTAWEDALVRLQPALRIAGAAPYLRLMGWVGGGRYAVLKMSNGLRVLDREAGALLPPSLISPRQNPLATTEAFIYCEQNLRAVRVRVGSWETEPCPYVLGLSAFGGDSQVDPRDRYASGAHTTFGGVFTRVIRAEDAEPVRTVSSSRVAFDWERGRMAWFQPPGRILFGDIEGDEQQMLQLEGMGNQAHLFQFLPDGRLLVADPLRVIDLERPGTATVLCRAPLREPARLSLDGSALLCGRRGLDPFRTAPARVSLLGSRLPALLDDAPLGDVIWHPRGDLCAWSPRDGDAELCVLRDGRRRTLLRLPYGHRPLGWAPDGLGLLVLKGLDEQGSLLELWTAKGAQ